MSAPIDPLPFLLALGWVVRVPGVSRGEGHEAITRAAWKGMGLSADQQSALIHGVRAPDVSIAGTRCEPGRAPRLRRPCATSANS